MEFVELWKIAKRRKWIVFVTFAAIFGAVMLLTLRTPNMYEAKARVLVNSSDSLSALMTSLGLPQFAAAKDETSPALKGQENAFATEIALATIRPVAEKIVAEFELTNRAGEPLPTKRLTKQNLLSRIVPHPYIEVAQYEDTDLLEISARARDPEQAAAIANRLAELLIEDRLDQMRSDYSAARTFISDQMTDIRETYFQLLTDRKDFMVEAQTVDLESEMRNLLQLISTLKHEYDENEITIAESERSVALVESKIGGKDYVSDSLTDTLESRLAEVLVDVSGNRILTGAKPDIDELNERVGTVREIISGQADFVLNEEVVSLSPVYADLVRDLKNAWINQRVAETKRDLLRAHIDRYQSELIQIPVKRIRNSEIELALDVQQSIYSSVLQYQTHVGVAEAMTVSDIQMRELASAVDAEKPVSPKKAFAGVFGIAMGLFWAFALAFLAEYVDVTVKSPGELSDAGLAVLGTIPRSPRSPLLSDLDPNDPVYEAYCRTAAGVGFVGGGEAPKKLLVTSVHPHAGATTVLVNLGIVFAREGKKVLVVDTDLRRPKVHALLGLGNDRGLTDLLLGASAPESVIQEAQIPGLSVLSSGPPAPDAGMLIRSNQLAAATETFAREFDVVLFDSAPLLIKSDALTLMKTLDAMVLVAKNATTTNPMIARVNAMLAGADIVPVGVVLNCFERASARGRKRGRRT